MTNTPQDRQENQPSTNLPATQALLPDIEVDTVAQSSADYQNLPFAQKTVLLAIMEDFISENIRSDVQIAADCGIDRKTVYNCKVNPLFNNALAFVMPELVKAKVPKYLAQIEKHGEKDYKPLEFLLKYAGLYVPKSQNLNINANIGSSRTQNKPLSVVVDDVLIRLGELGWSEDRVSELVDRFRELRDEGAF